MDRGEVLGGAGTVPRPQSPQPQPTWDTAGERSPSGHVSKSRWPHPPRHRTFLLPGKPGSEARWIRGGRWKRPSGSAGMPRRGLSGVWRDSTGYSPDPPQIQSLKKSHTAPCPLGFYLHHVPSAPPPTGLPSTGAGPLASPRRLSAWVNNGVCFLWEDS